MKLTVSVKERTMGRLTLHDTPLGELKLVERQRAGDERGWFSRFFCREELAPFGTGGNIAQINQTLTRTAGTVRGLHFQRPPHAETKLVSCIRGEVFDVAVDLRPGSPTFLKWYGTVLSADNGRALMIPTGFAHGFQTLVADCELLYLHDVPYAPGAEGGINALDPTLAIIWPLPVALLSNRDRMLPRIDDLEFG
jgi:dTDP-4-dehydrorhamnose 3,5-epimerase